MIRKIALGLLSCFAMHCFATSLDKLTLEEKVGQLFMVHFHGEEANEDSKRLIQDLHVGGIIYYNWSNELNSPDQVERLSSQLQKQAKIPLLIAVDNEGGRVTRLTKGFTPIPSNQEIGESGDTSLCERYALTMGREIRAVGVNMNFAPVVDINSTSHSVIGLRSYGNTPEIVIAFAQAALQGYHEAGLLTTLKHYPGLGGVEVDSHKDLPVLNKSEEDLKKWELLPFVKLAHQTDAIMTAHLMVPAIDPCNCITLSKKALDYLREEISFTGVIVSDSLVMEGVLKNCPSVDEVAIRALNAGCDLLLFGGRQLVEGQNHLELQVSDIQRIHGSVVNAVKENRISEERLNSAVQRILRLKSKFPKSKK